MYFMNEENVSTRGGEKSPQEKVRRRRARVTSRDLEILKFIEAGDFVDCQAVRKKFWRRAKKPQHHCHYRRLRILRGLGLLRFVALWGRGRWGVAVTAKGRKITR